MKSRAALLALLLFALPHCGSSPQQPACMLDCTGLHSDGACYCQTTCTGAVQIFTCSGGVCVCQGSHAGGNVSALCNSMAAAQEIYQACFTR